MDKTRGSKVATTGKSLHRSGRFAYRSRPAHLISYRRRYRVCGLDHRWQPTNVVGQVEDVSLCLRQIPASENLERLTEAGVPLALALKPSLSRTARAPCTELGRVAIDYDPSTARQSIEGIGCG